MTKFAFWEKYLKVYNDHIHIFQRVYFFKNVNILQTPLYKLSVVDYALLARKFEASCDPQM